MKAKQATLEPKLIIQLGDMLVSIHQQHTAGSAKQLHDHECNDAPVDSAGSSAELTFCSCSESTHTQRHADVFHRELSTQSD